MGLGDSHGDVESFVRVASSFQRPRALVESLESVRREIPRADLFNRPALKPLQEAYHAGLFGAGFEVALGVLVEVRIVEPEPFPDFQLRLRGKTLDFEVTSAVESGLGASHRGEAALGPPPLRPPEGKLGEFDPTELIRVVRRKAEKRYVPPPHLLVYMVLEGAAVGWETVRKAVVEGGGSAFASAWVMTPTHLMCALPWDGLDGGRGWSRLPVQFGPE